MDVENQRAVHVRALVEAERRRCHELWVDGNGACEPPELRLPSTKDRKEERLPRVIAEEIRDAARATGKRTVATYDGLHPRRFALLSDGAPRAVSIIISACELAGMDPPQLDAGVAPAPRRRTGPFGTLSSPPAGFALTRRRGEGSVTSGRRGTIAQCSTRGPVEARSTQYEG